MQNIQDFTITIFTENHIGLLNRITIIFTRRHINIESLTVSASEIPGIHKFTIVVRSNEEQIIKVVKQIDKLVEVLRASYHTEEDIIFQEIALYKVPTSAFIDGNKTEAILRDWGARILRIEPNYTVIEKTGHQSETQELLEKLRPFGVLQFVRSGRVAVTKQMKEMASYLREIDHAHNGKTLQN